MGNPTVMPLWFGGETGISNTLDISGVDAVVGLITPPAWLTAMITIQGSPDGERFFTLYEGRNTSRVSFSVPPGMMVTVNPNMLRCCKAIRLVSGSPDNPIPQGEPREFGLVVEMAAELLPPTRAR
jgi:hypothetical protein